MDRFALARRALASGSDLVVIDDERNILAAVEAGWDLLEVYDQLSGAERKLLFPTTRAPRTFGVARLPPPPKPKTVGQSGGDVLVLDGVRGPGNIGAVVRVGAAFDMAAVIALDVSRRELFRRAALRAGGPAMFTLPLLTMGIDEFVDFARRNDLVIAATSPHAGSMDLDMKGRVAIALGSETEGCRPEVVRVSTVRLRIPINPTVESLNVSAAAAVLAYQRSEARLALHGPLRATDTPGRHRSLGHARPRPPPPIDRAADG